MLMVSRVVGGGPLACLVLGFSLLAHLPLLGLLITCSSHAAMQILLWTHASFRLAPRGAQTAAASRLSDGVRKARHAQHYKTRREEGQAEVAWLPGIP